jgi:hypothetical protein
VVSKQPKQTKIIQNFAAPVLEYDLVENIKKIRANISIFELLKFPLILQKMLQSIAENNKNNDLISKKSTNTDSNKDKYIPGKKSSENQDKRDTSEKIVGNLDKIVLGTTIKNQQNFVVSSRKNVPPLLLTFTIFNRNVHNCMVDSSALSNLMPMSVCQKLMLK